MTVGELVEKATIEELNEWLGYFELEEIDRGDWQRTALLASTFVNVSRTVARGRVPAQVKLKDFLPVKRKAFQTTREQINMLKALAGKQNKRRG